MNVFKQYRRTNIAEMRPVTEEECNNEESLPYVSISQVDLDNGSPKIGDMIARNPENHNDQWLVAKEYFELNFEEIQKEKEDGDDWLSRIKIEYKELSNRLDKLLVYLTETPEKEQKQRELLILQASIMESYKVAIEARILMAHKAKEGIE